mgnify:CR=1 FL=1
MSTALALQGEQKTENKARKKANLKSVDIPKIDKSEVLEMLGWARMPASLISAIDKDLEEFIREFKGQYSTVDERVRQRRNRIQYWMNNYKNGICSLETAYSAMKS